MQLIFIIFGVLLILALFLFGRITNVKLKNKSTILDNQAENKMAITENIKELGEKKMDIDLNLDITKQQVNDQESKTSNDLSVLIDKDNILIPLNANKVWIQEITTKDNLTDTYINIVEKGFNNDGYPYTFNSFKFVPESSVKKKNFESESGIFCRFNLNMNSYSNYSIEVKYKILK